MKKEEKRLYPGDVGYPGGEYRGTMVIDGKAKNVHIKKDNNGNIVAVGAGKAVITVTSLDNGVTVSFPVEVGAEDTLYAGSYHRDPGGPGKGAGT